MSREAMVKLYSGDNVQSIIYHHECFGWELIQITDTRLVFSRETQDEVYDELVEAIRNRTNSGFCPMETAVLEINENHPIKDKLIDLAM